MKQVGIGTRRNYAKNEGARKKAKAHVTAPEASNSPELRLDMYIRHGCHLCDEMIHVLSEFRNDYNFSIRTVDIDADAALRERYNTLVPVLCLGDKEICHHFFDLQAFAKVVSEARH